MDCMNESRRFAARLNELMETEDLTSKAVARGTGLSQQTILAYRKGQRNPTMHAILALCTYLGVSADWLLGLKGVR